MYCMSFGTYPENVLSFQNKREYLSDGEQILRRNTNQCDINALPPVNSNGKEGVAMKQLRY